MQVVGHHGHLARPVSPTPGPGIRNPTKGDGMSGRATSASLRLVLISMTLANAMILVDQTAVPLILPSVMNTFGIGSALAQWVLNASLLPLAGLLVLGGRLGDLLGRRRIFLLGAALFGGASAVAGLAPEFWILLLARVVQGCGGALMLPATVAIISAAYPPDGRGRALGTMGGTAAIAGALGPTIGGALTSLLSWRAVLLINLPLLLVVLWCTLRAVPADPPRQGKAHVDVSGSLLLCVALVGLVFGLSQTAVWPASSPGVWVPVLVAVGAGVLFVRRERRAHNPADELRAATAASQLSRCDRQPGPGRHGRDGSGTDLPAAADPQPADGPGLAGLALIPTALPMVLLAPLTGRWYDRSGGRPPMTCGFLILALSGVLLAATVSMDSYLWLLPGLLAYGTGLAIVLTVNDPVSVDSVPGADQGQASGVSATAEQGGGALGIAVLYAVFHQVYLTKFYAAQDAAPGPDLDPDTTSKLKDILIGDEQTGLKVSDFGEYVQTYLIPAREASNLGYAVTFLVVTALSLVGAASAWWLVRRPADPVAQDGGTVPA
jgi:MFS family permease